MKTLAILFTTLLLTACVAPVLTHPTKTDQEFHRDLRDCEIVGEKRAADIGHAGNIFIEADEINDCMQSKHGWRVASR